MVRLEPMAEAEFQSYIATAVEGYAQMHIKAGDCAPEDALTLAKKDYEELLPRGLQSENQFLYSVRDDALGTGEAIGMIWFGVNPNRVVKSAFIYDLSIREDLRGKGYGRQVMERLEEIVQGMGIGAIRLNVFGFNHAARALYERMGYQITGIGMTKTLESR